jgi:hypothetical protein
MTGPNKVDDGIIVDDSLPNDVGATPPAKIDWLGSFESLRTRMLSIGKILASSIQIGQSFVDAMQPVMRSITQAYENYGTIASAINSALETYSQVITKIIKELHIPELSDEEKKQLLESNRAWGRMGWTWFPTMSVNYYDNPPENEKAAITYVHDFCSKEQVDILLNGLRLQKIKQKDLDSAIFCYENRQYKACALMLYSIIDAKLLRLQPNDNKRNAKKGVKKLSEKIQQNEDNMLLFQALKSANFIAFLETIFEYGNNFKDEPPIANRNYINHGMNRRDVRKRDCIQLFCGLYNLMEFLSAA